MQFTNALSVIAERWLVYR